MRRIGWAIQVVLCGLLLTGCLGRPGPGVDLSIEPASGYAPLRATLKALPAGGNAVLVSYAWDLGDGAEAVGRIVEHDFTGQGTKIVRLVATDADGREAIAVGKVVLLNRLPHAEFTYQPYRPPIHQPVRFDATGSFDPDGEIAAFHWDFGDGVTAVGAIVEHAYELPQTAYRVVLTVTDYAGAVNEAFRWVEPIGCDH